MRVVIDNRVYDTETSRYSISWAERYCGSNEECWCVMYVKRTGEYFVHRIHKTDPDDVWYDKLHKGLELQTDDWFSIKPISKDRADYYYRYNRKYISGTKSLVDRKNHIRVWGDYKNTWQDLEDKILPLIENADKSVKKEDHLANLVKVEWDAKATCKEYCTAWITYTIGGEKLRKRARLYSGQYSGLWVKNKDFWAVLRFLIGNNLEQERKYGDITMKRLKSIIKETDHFHSEVWDKWLRDFAWNNNYGGYTEKPWIQKFMDKVGDEYVEGSDLVGYF